jgi:hypothetical protein
MDLTIDQSQGIKKFIQDWSKDKKFELETSFGVGGVVDSNTFLQIAQRLRTKGFEVLPQDDYLNIITPNHIRFSLQGLGVLQNYCKDDTLKGKIFTAMFKDRAFQESNIDIKEYDVRIKVRREEELSNDDPRVLQLSNAWEAQKKAFRLIRRWSFKGKGIRIDMSMVRQTPTLPTGQYQWTSRFLDKNVLVEMPRYEVEVELLHDTEDTDTEEKALKSLIRGIGEVQRAIQKNSLLIRNSKIQSVRNEYQVLTGNAKFRGVGPVTMQLQNMIYELNPSIPNVRTGYNVTDKADGLRTMGFVDKEGDFFLVDQSLNIYRTGLKSRNCANSLVDGEWVTLDKDGNAIHHYLIFDIYHFNEEKVSHLPFAVFKEGILDTDADSRYNTMHTWYKQWINASNGGVEITAKGITDANKLMIALKHFEFANDSAIFRLGCAKILDTSRMYHTDGLILTSNSEPIPDSAGVRFNQQFKWKPAKDNTVDFLITYERDADIASLDKITTSFHSGNNKLIQYKTMRLYVGGAKGAEFENPRATILLGEEIKRDKGDTIVRYKPVLFNPLEFPDTMANTCNVEIHKDNETMEEYVMTEDTHEPIPNRSIVEMRYEPQREPGWKWVPSRIRHDKTERLMRAVAKGGVIKYSGMMNDEAVANSVWNSIHDPVTESMIRSGNEVPTEEEVKDIIAIRESDVGKKYYERKAPKENIALIKGLQDFHNKYIKNDILIKKTLQSGNKNLLDFACGKGGDLYKWINNYANYVIGVDIAGENITNINDGAYKRYIEVIKQYGRDKVPKIAFAIGNSSKSLITGEAAPNPEERDILRSIFGKVQPEGSLPKYIETVMAGSFRAGADVAACMFAIHYFFENMNTLSGLLNNLSDTVKIGGYFIGCCFDGDKVFDLLRNVQKGHSKSGEEGDVPIWTITKEYDREDLLPDDDSIGLAIDVDFISIGSKHREYLVSFELLKEKMKTIGFRLLNDDELKEIGLTHSTNTFDVSHKMAEKADKYKKYFMPSSVKEFSFLNRWFIFKRHGDIEVPVEPIEVPIEEKMEDEEDEEVKEEVKAPKERQDALPARDRRFTDKEIFRFGTNVRDLDILKVKNTDGKPDTFIGRWLGLSGRFPIPDQDDSTIEYPTIEHYMAGMKLKHASNKPDLAVTLMSMNGSIHQAMLRKRRTNPVARESEADFDLLEEEMKEVRKQMLKTHLNKYKVTFSEDAWSLNKDKLLKYALEYRWNKDARFKKGVEAARELGMYLLYTTKPATASELGGIRDSTGKIDGENKVGRMIMELAEFKF